MINWFAVISWNKKTSAWKTSVLQATGGNSRLIRVCTEWQKIKRKAKTSGSLVLAFEAWADLNFWKA